jgi:hypothetical protein
LTDLILFATASEASHAMPCVQTQSEGRLRPNRPSEEIEVFSNRPFFNFANKKHKEILFAKITFIILANKVALFNLLIIKHLLFI